MIRALCIAAAVTLSAAPAFAQDMIRIATFNASLTRSGPGVLINRLAEGGDDQIKAAAQIIRKTRPDIILINEFDHDPVGLAADMFVELLGKDADGVAGVNFAYTYDAPPNTGYLSGQDLNGDGKVGGPEDAFGFGRFPGQYGMLLLSTFPIEDDKIRDFSKLGRADIPDAALPVTADGGPFPSGQAQAVMRLSSKGHWDVPVQTPLGTIHIFASHPTPPVFDGPEDANGLRNADEIRFWSHYLNGVAFPDQTGQPVAFAGPAFAILGDLNADPFDGDGVHEAIASLLAHPRVTDPLPSSKGAVDAATLQRGGNTTQQGDPALDTADWNDTRGPGNLRVDYVLPSRDLTVVDAGVFWPTRTDPDFALIGAGKPVSSDHRLVWVDVSR